MTLSMCAYTRVEIEFPPSPPGIPSFEAAIEAVRGLDLGIKEVADVLIAIASGSPDAIEAAKRAAIDGNREATRNVDGPFAFTEADRATFGAWAMSMSAAAALASAAQRPNDSEARVYAVHYADLARAHDARAQALAAPYPTPTPTPAPTPPHEFLALARAALFPEERWARLAKPTPLASR